MTIAYVTVLSLLSSVSSAIQNEECFVGNMTLCSKLDQTKFLGKWYELSYMTTPPFLAPMETSLSDFVYQMQILENDGIKGIFTTRSTLGKRCLSVNFKLKNKQHPAKFEYLVEELDVISHDFWIVSVDYLKYAVAYSCHNVSDNGTCSDSEAWIWSRTPSLDRQTFYTLRLLLADMCVDVIGAENTDWSYRKECEVETFEKVKKTNVKNTGWQPNLLMEYLILTGVSQLWINT